MQLRNLRIGESFPAFVAAEISGNHGGSLRDAIDLIRHVSASGAQGVKFQTYTAETLSINVKNQYFKLPPDSPWKHLGNQYELYKRAYTPWEWFPELFSYARELNLIPFSSPFDESAVDFLEQLGCPIYKVASPEINHIPLITRLAKTGKPIIMSLGVASHKDVSLAVEVIRENSSSEMILLQCETKYPASPYDANLKLLRKLQNEFQCIVGISDHTLGHELVDVAVGAGAKFFEKHIKHRDKRTVDDFFSADPDQFKSYVLQIRKAERVLGKELFRFDREDPYRLRNSRSIFAFQDIAKGDIFTEKNIKIVRPGLGLDPMKFNDLVGKVAKRNIKKGEPLIESDLQ